MHIASSNDQERDTDESFVVSASTAVRDFDELYQSKHDDMVRMSYFLTGSMSQAEEAVQDSFIRVLERWAKIDDHAAYLRTTVVNRCRSWHRSRLVALRWGPRLQSRGHHHDQPNEMADALSKLTRRRREVIVLRFYEELSLLAIAASLGISEGTVKSTCITPSTISKEHCNESRE